MYDDNRRRWNSTATRACANSRYQALSLLLNRPGYEASCHVTSHRVFLWGMGLCGVRYSLYHYKLYLCKYGPILMWHNIRVYLMLSFSHTSSMLNSHRNRQGNILELQDCVCMHFISALWVMHFYATANTWLLGVITMHIDSSFH